MLDGKSGSVFRTLAVQAKDVCTYTIPSCSAITTHLQQVVLVCCTEKEEFEGLCMLAVQRHDASIASHSPSRVTDIRYHNFVILRRIDAQ